MKLLSGRNFEVQQQQLVTPNLGFSLTNALAQQIVQMDSGEQVKFILAQRLFFSHATSKKAIVKVEGIFTMVILTVVFFAVFLLTAGHFTTGLFVAV